MRKIFLTVIMLFVFQQLTFADEILTPDYSAMTGSFEQGSVEVLPVDFSDAQPIPENLEYSISLCADPEELMYQNLCDYLFADKLCSDNVIFSNNKYHLVVPTPYSFSGSVALSGNETEEQVVEKLEAQMQEDNIGYKINALTNDIFNTTYMKFISDNPELFYVSRFGLGVTQTYYSYNLYYKTASYEVKTFFGAGLLENIDIGDMTLACNIKTLKEMYADFDSKAQTIANSLIFDGMTDLDKLLLAHDYITEDCVYFLTSGSTSDTYTKGDTEYYGDGFSHTAYGVIVNKKAVCDGYAYAYKTILKKLGYPCEDIRIITSDELEHAWNLVKLNNKWYHVDVTWDDPVVYIKQGDKFIYDMNNKDYYQTRHKYFLIDHNTNGYLRIDEETPVFYMSLLGYSNSKQILSSATDTTYLEGYIFNDPLNGNSQSVPGKIIYKDGHYQKYYNNDENLHFQFNSLKAPAYGLSHLYSKKDSANPFLQIVGFSKKTPPMKNTTVYICFYDTEGRLLNVDKTIKTFSSFGEYDIPVNIPQNTKQIRIFASDDTALTPIGNVSFIR